MQQKRDFNQNFVVFSVPVLYIFLSVMILLQFLSNRDTILRYCFDLHFITRDKMLTLLGNLLSLSQEQNLLSHGVKQVPTSHDLNQHSNLNTQPV